MTVDELLTEEITNLREEIKGMNPGTKEYVASTKRLDNLITKAIEMDKNYLDAEIKRDQIEKEHEDKQQQINEDRKSRIVNGVISVAGIVLPIVVTVWGTNKSLKFEETGTVTTMAGRGFITKLFPKK